MIVSRVIISIKPDPDKDTLMSRIGLSFHSLRISTLYFLLSCFWGLEKVNQIKKPKFVLQ